VLKKEEARPEAELGGLRGTAEARLAPEQVVTVNDRHVDGEITRIEKNSLRLQHGGAPESAYPGVVEVSDRARQLGTTWKLRGSHPYRTLRGFVSTRPHCNDPPSHTTAFESHSSLRIAPSFQRLQSFRITRELSTPRSHHPERMPSISPGSRGTRHPGFGVR
jgi:hypothetical protein